MTLYKLCSTRPAATSAIPSVATACHLWSTASTPFTSRSASTIPLIILSSKRRRAAATSSTIPSSTGRTSAATTSSTILSSPKRPASAHLPYGPMPHLRDALRTLHHPIEPDAHDVAGRPSKNHRAIAREYGTTTHVGTTTSSQTISERGLWQLHAKTQQDLQQIQQQLGQQRTRQRGRRHYRNLSDNLHHRRPRPSRLLLRQARCDKRHR